MRCRKSDFQIMIARFQIGLGRYFQVLVAKLQTLYSNCHFFWSHGTLENKSFL